MTHPTILNPTRIAMVALFTLSALACSSGDGDKNGGAAPDSSGSNYHCTALGTACDMASDPCCYDNGAQTQCTDGTCQLCADTGAACTDVAECCVGHACMDGTCCLNVGAGGCKTTADCCGGSNTASSLVSCSGTRCCLNSGTEISCSSSAYNICCSGSGYERTYTEASTYTLCYCN